MNTSFRIRDGRLGAGVLLTLLLLCLFKIRSVAALLGSGVILFCLGFLAGQFYKESEPAILSCDLDAEKEGVGRRISVKELASILDEKIFQIIEDLMALEQYVSIEAEIDYEIAKKIAAKHGKSDRLSA